MDDLVFSLFPKATFFINNYYLTENLSLIPMQLQITNTNLIAVVSSTSTVQHYNETQIISNICDKTTVDSRYLDLPYLE